MSTKNKNSIIIIISLVLLASILRTPITSVGGVVGLIKEQLNMSNTLAGVLTTVPLIAFLLISPFANSFAIKKGLEKTLLISILIIIIGLILRFYVTTTVIFIATFIIGVGIAFGNVLIPVLTKKYYSHNMGVMTGLYTVIMSITAAIGAGLSYPIANNITSKELGIATAINCWLVIAVLSALCFIIILKNSEVEKSNFSKEKIKNIWKNPKLYSITLVMGLQSALFYCSVSWFGEIMLSKGFSVAESSILLSTSQFAQLPATFFIPIIMEKIKNNKIIPLLITLGYVLALVIMIYGQNNFWLMIFAVVCYALAGGGSFSYVMYLFSAKTKTDSESATVSGIAQSGGYFLAAIFPPLLGYIKDIATWNEALYILLSVAIILLFSMMHVSKDGNIINN